jgi:hypothetical protein
MTRSENPRTRAIAFAVSLVLNAWLIGGRPEPACGDVFKEAIQPILQKHCVACHSTIEQEGELDLERFTSSDDFKNAPLVWEQVIEQINHNEMPPAERPPLSAEERKLVVDSVQQLLDKLALESAGDPGPIAIRRLSNAEYTYTLRDLTGVESLDVAKEFPTDGAAGEGFTNAGAALVMSPSLLTKYLDAAKDVSRHVVLLPDGIRFSPSTSSRDWSDETLAMIRQFYSRYSDSTGATPVNLQGIRFDTNAGGRLDVEKYLRGLLHAKQLSGKDLAPDDRTLEDVSLDRGLNRKYLTLLSRALHQEHHTPVLDSISSRLHLVNEDTLPQLTQWVHAWQQSLWRFSSVGHIGKVNGPKAWQEPVSPIVQQQESRFKLDATADGGDVTIYLVASDAGDGNQSDEAIWDNGRLERKGLPPIPMRDLRDASEKLVKHRIRVASDAVKCLSAIDDAEKSLESFSIESLAKKHDVAPESLRGWMAVVGFNENAGAELGPLISSPTTSSENTYVKSWSGADALGVIANSSDQTVLVPGEMAPHSIAVHPAPKVAAVIAWQSPVSGAVRVSGTVRDAHTACGNGIRWMVEVRRAKHRELLASGVTRGGESVSFGPYADVSILEGEFVTLVIDPLNGDHVCDLTSVELSVSDDRHQWNATEDLSADILAGNPHADRYGHPRTWHLVGEPIGEESQTLPAGSLLDQWRTSRDTTERAKLAEQLAQWLKDRALVTNWSSSLSSASPDESLVRQLFSPQSPLFSADVLQGDASDDNRLTVRAPQAVPLTIPAVLAEDAEFVVNARLLSSDDGEASVQMQVMSKEEIDKHMATLGHVKEALSDDGSFSVAGLGLFPNTPIITAKDGAATQRFETAFEDFRRLFPVALCYSQVVPVDEVVTLALYHREDDHLQRLMLSETECHDLDRLWDQLHFVSQSPLKQVDVFEQLYQFATQDADPSVFEPMREPVKENAARFELSMREAEPVHIQAVTAFAEKAWRRPLHDDEPEELKALYQQLHEQGMSHENAMRMTLARVLVSPAFLYRGEAAGEGAKASPINDWALATRLSYFLWASTPDDELRAAVAAGQLRDENGIAKQTARMLKDSKVRRMATEFGCQWLQVRDLETLDEKSERHFPTFVSLRGDMQEEVVRFFVDLIQQDRSVLSFLDSDHTFLNGPLAEHYGLKAQELDSQSQGTADDWRRFDGLHAAGRGGMLGFAATLAKQSGASRTSPILRGNWISEVVLGERLPRPPKGVPILPEETPADLTERELIERHSSDAKCASCHQRIDPFGFALEGFDAIGRMRSIDTSGHAIDTQATLPDGESIQGLEGLRSYLLTHRRDDFVRQFCRKLLGYALGRSVQLSDKPLIDEMMIRLRENDYRISAAVESIALSPQFRHVRGRDGGLNPELKE